MLLFTVLLVTTAATFPHVDSNSITDIRTPFSSTRNPRIARWANIALKFVTNVWCQQGFMSENECVKLNSTHSSSMNIYFAEGDRRGKLKALIRDGKLLNGSPHDAVLAIDPYPQSTVPHLRLIFFINWKTTADQCQSKGGYFAGNGECLSFALKNRCYNLIENGSKFFSKRRFSKRCEINYLPVVYIDAERAPINRLECVPYIEGSAACPTNEEDVLRINCDPIFTNNHRC